jgi:Family of unknown function (DUF6515)
MTHSIPKFGPVHLRAALTIAAMLTTCVVPPPPARAVEHEHEFHNTRYHFDHYYPARGTTSRVLPDDRVIIGHGRDRFFYSGGVWYQPDADGYVVVRPPYHAFVPILPPVYTTVWIGGYPYYYANDTYYLWRPDLGQYEVVPPPDDSTATTQPPPSSPDVFVYDVFVYPKNSQTETQQSHDKYECHKWAAQQTGFDPTQNSGGVPPDQLADRHMAYQRAMSACLEGRGYSVT